MLSQIDTLKTVLGPPIKNADFRKPGTARACLSVRR